MNTVFKVNDEVMVTDQNPPAQGKVLRVSTWKEVNGQQSTYGTCYLIKCETWAKETWIDESFLQRIKRKK